MAVTCSTCKFFAPLSPGHAAVCHEKWRGLEWNEAVPLTTADGYCDKHDPILLDAADCDSPFDYPNDPDPLREHS